MLVYDCYFDSNDSIVLFNQLVIGQMLIDFEIENVCCIVLCSNGDMVEFFLELLEDEILVREQ